MSQLSICPKLKTSQAITHFWLSSTKESYTKQLFCTACTHVTITELIFSPKILWFVKFYLWSCHKQQLQFFTLKYFNFYLPSMLCTAVLWPLLNPFLIIEWWGGIRPQGYLGSGPRCGSGSLGQYKTPGMRQSVCAQRGRARSALFNRVVLYLR